MGLFSKQKNINRDIASNKEKLYELETRIKDLSHAVGNCLKQITGLQLKSIDNEMHNSIIEELKKYIYIDKLSTEEYLKYEYLYVPFCLNELIYLIEDIYHYWEDGKGFDEFIKEKISNNNKNAHCSFNGFNYKFNHDKLRWELYIAIYKSYPYGYNLHYLLKPMVNSIDLIYYIIYMSCLSILEKSGNSNQIDVMKTNIISEFENIRNKL